MVNVKQKKMQIYGTKKNPNQTKFNIINNNDNDNNQKNIII